MVKRIVHTEGGKMCYPKDYNYLHQKIERFPHRKEFESNAIRMEQRFL